MASAQRMVSGRLIRLVWHPVVLQRQGFLIAYLFWIVMVIAIRADLGDKWCAFVVNIGARFVVALVAFFESDAVL